MVTDYRTMVGTGIIFLLSVQISKRLRYQIMTFSQTNETTRTQGSVYRCQLFPDSEDLINACIYFRLRRNKTICGFALSTRSHMHALTHQQALAPKTFPLSPNVQYILPSACSKTSTYSCL